MQDVTTSDASADQRLAALREKVGADLEVIAHPRMEWLSPRRAPDGTNALDVLIVGAGQSGIATAFGLKRARVENVLVVDRAERGREGPWLTYARMDTLRSPKDYTGPDLDIPLRTAHGMPPGSANKAGGTSISFAARIGRSTSSGSATPSPFRCATASR